jgi:hypothetical protein
MILSVGTGTDIGVFLICDLSVLDKLFIQVCA